MLTEFGLATAQPERMYTTAEILLAVFGPPIVMVGVVLICWWVFNRKLDRGTEVE